MWKWKHSKRHLKGCLIRLLLTKINKEVGMGENLHKKERYPLQVSVAMSKTMEKAVEDFAEKFGIGRNEAFRELIQKGLDS